MGAKMHRNRDELPQQENVSGAVHDTTKQGNDQSMSMDGHIRFFVFPRTASPASSTISAAIHVHSSAEYDIDDKEPFSDPPYDTRGKQIRQSFCPDGQVRAALRHRPFDANDPAAKAFA